MANAEKKKIIPKAWTKVNDPKKHPATSQRPVHPVNWDDLGGENTIHTITLRGFEYEVDRYEEVPEDKLRLNRQIELLWQVQEGKASFHMVNYKEVLDLHTKIYPFGDAVAPYFNILWADNAREVIDEIAVRGLYITNIWGHIPEITPPVPADIEEYLMQKLGVRYLGEDNGEHDCRFLLGPCDYFYGPAKSLRQGYENFMDYEYLIMNLVGRNYLHLGNNVFQHYLADIPYTKMIGCQICESKPNMNLWFSVLRGAGKQYGLLWWTSPAEWNLWGAKSYQNDEICYDDSEPTLSPVDGTSISLLHRAWVLSYMNGASVIMGQDAFFDYRKPKVEVLYDGEKRMVPPLSPVGEQQMQITNWMKEHPHRGVLYTPVALIWDFYTGYVTGKHAPLQSNPYHAWGNYPFEKGHYQIDSLTRALFPEHVESGYWRDERGFLTATPCSDMFDVLLSNVSSFVLNRYNAAIVIGPTKIEGRLLETLSQFIRQGGSVATTVDQLTETSLSLFGILSLGEWQKSKTGTGVDGTLLNEAIFSYRKVELDERAEVVSVDYYGNPLAFKIQTGYGGELLVFTSCYGLSDQVCEIPEKCKRETVLSQPYLLLRHVESLLFDWLQQWNLLRVEGSHPIQYFVNVTDSDREYRITLTNNSVHPWKGRIGFKNAQIIEADNWMNEVSINLEKELIVSLKVNDICVIAVKTDRPVVEIIEESQNCLENQFEFISEPIFDAFDKGERTCIALQGKKQWQGETPASSEWWKIEE